MIARHARHFAAALVATAALAASSAFAAPVNLSQVMPEVGAYFVTSGSESTAYATLDIPSGYLGSFGTAGLVMNDSTDVTSNLAVTVNGLPSGVSVSLSSASILWDSTGQNLIVKLEADGNAGETSWDATATITNKLDGTQVTVPVRVTHNPAETQG